MARLWAAVRVFGERVLEALLAAALSVLYLLVAAPLGAAWRLLRPHPSWRKAERTRWEDPAEDPGRGTLEGARRQS